MNCTPFPTYSSTLCTVIFRATFGQVWVLLAKGTTYQIRHMHSLPHCGGGGPLPWCPRIACLVVKHLGFGFDVDKAAGPTLKASANNLRRLLKNAILHFEGDSLYGGNFPIAAYLVWSCLSQGRFLDSRQRYLQKAGCQEPGELYTNGKCILGIS